MSAFKIQLKSFAGDIHSYLQEIEPKVINLIQINLSKPLKVNIELFAYYILPTFNKIM